MTDVTPTPEIIAYLAADPTLQGLAPGGVWEDPAPQDMPTPFVVVDYQTSVEHICGGGNRVTECYYLAKAVGPAAQIAQVRLAGLRVDALLHYGTLTVAGLAGYHVLLAQRTEAIEYPDPEPVTGIRWEHRGGQYRIDVEAA